MTHDEIDRIERMGLAQVGKEISTPIVVMPGELLALCALARNGLGRENERESANV